MCDHLWLHLAWLEYLINHSCSLWRDPDGNVVVKLSASTVPLQWKQRAPMTKPGTSEVSQPSSISNTTNHPRKTPSLPILPLFMLLKTETKSVFPSFTVLLSHHHHPYYCHWTPHLLSEPDNQSIPPHIFTGCCFETWLLENRRIPSFQLTSKKESLANCCPKKNHCLEGKLQVILCKLIGCSK